MIDSYLPPLYFLHYLSQIATTGLTAPYSAHLTSFPLLVRSSHTVGSSSLLIEWSSPASCMHHANFPRHPTPPNRNWINYACNSAPRLLSCLSYLSESGTRSCSAATSQCLALARSKRGKAGGQASKQAGRQAGRGDRKKEGWEWQMGKKGRKRNLCKEKKTKERELSSAGAGTGSTMPICYCVGTLVLRSMAFKHTYNYQRLK